MKKSLLTILITIFTLTLSFAQDVITKKSGEDILSKILEVSQSEIRYKRFDNPDGPDYIILKSDVLMIRYDQKK